MHFYTNVSRYGNNLLVRGYNNGKQYSRKIKYQPTFFVSTGYNAFHEDESGWQSLSGKPVGKVKMDSMRHGKDWLEANKNVIGRDIFGNDRHVFAYVNETFPGTIEFDRAQINVTTIDIEVASDDGFPHPEQADHPIISITSKNNIDNTYYVWGMGDYDVDNSMMTTHRVVYKQFPNETQLLIDYINFMHSGNTPDVITGWNVMFFDIPYLINRSLKILGDTATKKHAIRTFETQ